MGRQVGRRDVGRWVRRAGRRPRGRAHRRRHHDGRAAGDVRLRGHVGGDPVPDLHAAARAAAVLAQHAARVLGQLLGHAVRRVPAHRRPGLAVRHPAAVRATGVRRLRLLPGGRVGRAVQRGCRPAAHVRRVQDDIPRVDGVRAAYQCRVHVHAAHLPVPAQVRAAHAHRRRRQAFRADRVRRAHVHTDRALHGPGELQPDRVHTVHGHGGVH